MADALFKYRYELRARLSGSEPATAAPAPSGFGERRLPPDTMETWRAWDRIREQMVVLRLLKGRWVADEEAQRRWVRRLDRQRTAPIPGTSRILDVGRDDSQVWFVREYVEGPTLERWGSHPRGLPETLDCLLPVVRAVAALHELGAAHGRLHPGNIVLGDDGPVFCDFDVAEATESCFGPLPHGQGHGLAGEPGKHRVYLAPEVRAGQVKSAASDVYSVGVTMWELLTDRRGAPDSGLPLPTRVKADLPRGVDVVVEGMVKPEPDDRYPAAQAAEALAKLRSRAEPVMGRSPREVRRQRIRDRVELARKPLPWPVVVTLNVYRLLFILLGTLVITVGTFGFQTYAALRYIVETMPEEVIIPDVTGMSREEAKAWFEGDGTDPGLGLGFVVTIEQPSKTVPAGAVITTRPAPGRRVREGRIVEATISTGPELVTVPNLRETASAQARDRLERLGLKPGVVQYTVHPTLPAGYVISQDPGPGRRVDSGSQVHMKISEGPPEGAPGSAPPAADAPPAEPAVAAAASAPAADRRVGQVKVKVPSHPSLTYVRVVVRDDKGERTVYNQLHYAGDSVVKNVEGEGETVVEVYLNDTQVGTKVL